LQPYANNIHSHHSSIKLHKWLGLKDLHNEAVFANKKYGFYKQSKWTIQGEKKEKKT